MCYILNLLPACRLLLLGYTGDYIYIKQYRLHVIRSGILLTFELLKENTIDNGNG